MGVSVDVSIFGQSFDRHGRLRSAGEETSEVTVEVEDTSEQITEGEVHISEKQRNIYFISMSAIQKLQV